jgi:hypothetical protein
MPKRKDSGTKGVPYWTASASPDTGKDGREERSVNEAGREKFRHEPSVNSTTVRLTIYASPLKLFTTVVLNYPGPILRFPAEAQD